MATTRWAAVVDALVTAMRATSGYRAPTTDSTSIPVYDSLEWATTGDIPGSYMVVAWPGDPDDGGWSAAGTTSQDFGPMGTNRPRDESGEVVVRIVAQTGDMPPATARSAAQTMLGDLETVLRAAPTLGLSGVWSCFVVPAEWRMYYAEGAVCDLIVTVSYEARL